MKQARISMISIKYFRMSGYCMLPSDYIRILPLANLVLTVVYILS